MDSIEPRPPLLRPHGEAPYELLDGCFIVPCGSCGKKNSCCRDAGCHFGKDSERVDELTYVWIDVVSPLHGFLVCSPPSGVNVNMNMS